MPRFAAGKSTSSRIKGVRISCRGDIWAETDHLGTYDVPLDHDVFDVGDICPVSELIGIPLLVCRVRPSMSFAATQDSWSYTLAPSYYPNETVRKLMIDCDPELVRQSEGQATLLETAKRWTKEVGSVLIVRKDKKDLYAEHVEVLLDFIFTVLSVYPDGLEALVPLSDEEVIEAGRDKAKEPPPYLRTSGIKHLYTNPPEFLSPSDAVQEFTPGHFKEHYLRTRMGWSEGCESDVLKLAVPSPWPSDKKHGRYHRTPRDYERARYLRMTNTQRMSEAVSWREIQLLQEIMRLKDCLGKTTKALEPIKTSNLKVLLEERDPRAE